MSRSAKLLLVLVLLALTACGSTSESVRIVKGFTIEQGADLRGADLQGADLSGREMVGVDLSGANLSGANLSGANLAHATLIGATLTNANLTGANLYNANLTNANLTGANLDNANLTNANLTNANLTGAKVNNANLTDANLTGVTNLGVTNLTGLTTSPTTTTTEAGTYEPPAPWTGKWGAFDIEDVWFSCELSKTIQFPPTQEDIANLRKAQKALVDAYEYEKDGFFLIHSSFPAAIIEYYKKYPNDEYSPSSFSIWRSRCDESDLQWWFSKLGLK